jgi:hypothetical protein
MEKKYLFQTKLFPLVLLIICQFLQGCEFESDPNNTSLKDIKDNEYINNFHKEFAPKTETNVSKNKPAVYVDFSDGITDFALGNSDIKNIYDRFFETIINDDTTNNFEFFELHTDTIIQYFKKDEFAHFTEEKGYKKGEGFFSAAPIDKAIDAIVKRDNVGVLITDGELARIDSTGKASVMKSPWATTALKTWFTKGNELSIVCTDFTETVGGIKYKKHMYFMFFIPKSKVKTKKKMLK